jgi:S1-C subfamily serine protease
MSSRRTSRSLADTLLTLLLTGGITWFLTLPLAGQQVMADPEKTLLLREIGAVTEMGDDGLDVLVALPAEARPEAYRDADVLRGDVVLVINGQRIRSLDTARTLYEQAAIGAELALGIDRGGIKHVVRFTKADPATLPTRFEFRSPGGGGPGGGQAVAHRMVIGGGEGDVVPVQGLGVVLQESAEKQVTVALVLPGSTTVLKDGDRLLRCAGQDVASAKQVGDAVEPLAVGAEIALEIERDGKRLALRLVKEEGKGQLILRRQG